MFGYYLQLAAFSLKRNAALTSLMILAIAIGISACMTSLSVVRLLRGDPLPGKSDKVFYVQLDYRPQGGASETSPPLVMPYRDAQALISNAPANQQAAMDAGMVSIQPTRSEEAAFVVDSWYTTAGFFPMFDVGFKYGSGWDAQSDHAHERVAVISGQLNNRLFNGENSVGSMLNLAQGQFRIIGVLSDWRPIPKFYNVTTSKRFALPEDVYIPLSAAIDASLPLNGAIRCFGAEYDPTRKVDSSCGWLFFWAQLDTPASVSAYESYLNNYSAHQHVLGRFERLPNSRIRDIPTLLTDMGVVPSDVAMQSWASFGFLVVCLVNCVGLMLAKFMSRGVEATIRRSLGARTKDIFLQFLVEAALIGIVGGILGLLLTELGLMWVRSRSQDYASLVHLDMPIVAIALSAAVIGSLIAGTLPAWRICRTPPALNLKGS